MSCRRLLLSAFCLCALTGPLVADEPKPRGPETYEVIVRYRIDAFRNDRIVLYDQMMDYLKGLGFDPGLVPDTEADNRESERLTGTVPAANARKLLQENHVRSLILIPKDARAAEKPDAPVRVALELTGKLPLDRQRLLVEQTRKVLGTLGFRESFGYDHRGYTRLVGSLPLDKVSVLGGDLRRLPEGAKQPLPFEHESPVKVTEVFPELTVLKDPPKLAELPKDQEKIGPSLRVLLGTGVETAPPVRMEIILTFTPAANETAWERDLERVAPGVSIEGRVGPLVTALALPSQAVKLAGLPTVSVVRLPETARPQARAVPGAEGDNAALLKAVSLDKLHGLGFRGRGIRVAVVDSDFRGWRGLVGKKLPKDVHYVDFTAEHNSDLAPDPQPEDGTLGHGTRCALAVLVAAPEAELVLVRIDAGSPYQLLEFARYVNGEVVRSFVLETRGAEATLKRQRLEKRRDALLLERRLVLSEFGTDADPQDVQAGYGALVGGLGVAGVGFGSDAAMRRKLYFARQRAFDRDEQALQRMEDNYIALLQGYRDLGKVRVVASSLVWNEGHPVDGGSSLSRYFDDTPFRSALWFQAAGNTRGQVWSGLFRDSDGNGVMEFAPASNPPRPDRWWRLELNFLGWQPPTGEQALDLPQGAHLRLAAQWREPHDPTFQINGEDVYVRPLATLRLVLVHQPDPTGAARPADDLEVAASSVGPALRLQNAANSAVYEQTVEFTVPAAGRYALRVEGSVPASIRPRGEPTLPALEKTWELRPRIFVDTLEGPAGRCAFHDYATEDGTLGMPADAHRVLTIGAADVQGQREPYSAAGPPFGMELLRKPNFLAYDRLILDGAETSSGTSIAAGWAAGLAASVLSTGVAEKEFRESLPSQPGEVIRVARQFVDRSHR